MITNNPSSKLAEGDQFALSQFISIKKYPIKWVQEVNLTLLLSTVSLTSLSQLLLLFSGPIDSGSALSTAK